MILLLLAVVLTSGCGLFPLSDSKPMPGIPSPNESNQSTISGNKTISLILDSILPEKIPSTQVPEPVSSALSDYEYHRYSDPNVISHAESLVQGCEDDECKVLRVHRYVIENFYYREYEDQPKGMAWLSTKGYGICGDFTVFYYTYLKSLGIEVYVALLEDHTYALPCNLDMEKFRGYIGDDANFKSFTQEYALKNFEFELNHAFNRTCLRLEGPSSERGFYRYPGEHYADTKIVENKSFFLDPETERWEYLSESDVTVEESRVYIERHFRFNMSRNRAISWSVTKITKKSVGRLDYEFTVPEVIMSTEYRYATFTLPEVGRHERVRLHITVQATNPFLFYTLQDENQLSGFEYSVEHPDKMRDEEKAHRGRLPWEFDYISSCSQKGEATFFDRECLLSDAGRRVFVLYNLGYFKSNEVNVTVTYLEFL